MNPNKFANLYDGLQAIKDEKNENTRSARKKNYQTRGTQQQNTSQVTKVHVAQKRRRFSNFNHPLSKILKHLVQKGLL